MYIDNRSMMFFGMLLIVISLPVFIAAIYFLLKFNAKGFKLDLKNLEILLGKTLKVLAVSFLVSMALFLVSLPFC